MRILVTLLLFACFTSFGQDDTHIEKRKCDSLELIIAQIQTSNEAVSRDLYKLKLENKTLKDVMRGYVAMIDSLNTELIKFTGVPDEVEVTDEIRVDNIEIRFVLDTTLVEVLSKYEKGVTTFGGPPRKPGFQEEYLTPRKVLVDIEPNQITYTEPFVIKLALFVDSK